MRPNLGDLFARLRAPGRQRSYNLTELERMRPEQLRDIGLRRDDNGRYLPL